jgi:hypothetical protein
MRLRLTVGTIEPLADSPIRGTNPRRRGNAFRLRLWLVRGSSTAACSVVISGGSTIYTGRSRLDGRVRCAAAVRIGTVEVSNRPVAVNRRLGAVSDRKLHRDQT